MTFTIQDAKSIIYDTVLRRKSGAPPEDTPVLLDRATIEKPWGWVFFCKNERYNQTHDTRWLWLTRLEFKINGQSKTAWTLGFEAFGPTLSLIDIFQSTCREALKESPDLNLPLRPSACYPQWLEAQFHQASEE